MRLLHPDLAKGTIASIFGALKGTMLVAIPTHSMWNLVEQDVVAAPLPLGVCHARIDVVGCDRVLEEKASALLTLSKRNALLKEHLHVDFNRGLENLKCLLEDIENGTIHPSMRNQVFHVVKDGLGMELQRLLDMLERCKVTV